MRSLRIYFIMSLVWLLTGLTLVACSDKDKNNGSGIHCPPGMIQINGMCTYDPNNPPNGGGSLPPGGYGFNPNGNITDDSQFRDFNYRLYNQYYYCAYNYPYSCDDAQIKIQKINETQYSIYLTSPSLSGGSVILTGNKFTYDGSDDVIFEVYYGNPYPYIIAELVLHQGLSGTSTNYTFRYKGNPTTTIITGTMRKGIDY